MIGDVAGLSKKEQEESSGVTCCIMDAVWYVIFRLDRGMLAPEPQDRQIDQEDPTCPINISAQYQQHGWIAEYLGFLNCIVSALLGSV